jgi:hypothetical protein
MAKFKFRLPKKLTRKQERAIDSVGADNAQKLNYRESSTEDELLSIMNNPLKIELDENFRNSYSIFNFARQFILYEP